MLGWWQIHLYPRKIWLILPGQSENDANGIRGGDTTLSEEGGRYSQALCELARVHASKTLRAGHRPHVLTGTLRRYEQVADMLCGRKRSGGGGGSGGGDSGGGIGGGDSGDSGSGGGVGGGDNGSGDGALVSAGGSHATGVDGAGPGTETDSWAAATRLRLKALNELCFGALEGLPGGKLRHSFPQEFHARAFDPLNYRYPGVGGESYMDLVTNCRDVVLTLERLQTDVAVVCDVAVARVLLGYFEGTAIDQIPNIPVDPGLIELERSHSGFSRSHLRVDVGKPSLLVAS